MMTLLFTKRNNLYHFDIITRGNIKKKTSNLKKDNNNGVINSVIHKLETPYAEAIKKIMEVKCSCPCYKKLIHDEWVTLMEIDDKKLELAKLQLNELNDFLTAL